MKLQLRKIHEGFLIDESDNILYEVYKINKKTTYKGCIEGVKIQNTSNYVYSITYSGDEYTMNTLREFLLFSTLEAAIEDFKKKYNCNEVEIINE